MPSNLGKPITLLNMSQSKLFFVKLYIFLQFNALSLKSHLLIQLETHF